MVNMVVFLKIINITLLITIISCQVSALNKESYIKTSDFQVTSDFPAHKDLIGYLNSLDRIVFFFLNNKQYLDLNTLFGLFLVNVNIRPFVHHDVLPVSIRSHVKYLLMQTDELLELRFQEDFLSKTTWMNIASLFSNDTEWSMRISKLDLESPKNIYFDRFPKWSKYQRAVDDIDSNIPHPRLSDLCLQLLAESEENVSTYPERCQLPADCYNALMFGTNYGYALTHRLLLLINARISRGCFILSVHMDELMRSSFCEMSYSEAEYNADNGYGNVDIMFEQIALCTLDGHGKFLRKSWLSSLLQYQTSWGCFDETQPVASRDHILEKTSPLDEDQCSGHVTAVAAATLASAVRLILENY